jgi:hypothetical protein
MTILDLAFSGSRCQWPRNLVKRSNHWLGRDVAIEGDRGSPGSDGASPYHLCA